MDLIVVSDSAVGASTPSIIVDEINILVSGNATSTKYLDGLGKIVIEVSKDTVTAIKDNETYIFNPIINEIGAYTVAKTNNIKIILCYKILFKINKIVQVLHFLITLLWLMI